MSWICEMKWSGVLDLRDEVERAAGHVADERDRQQHPDERAVRADVALLELVGPARPAQHVAGERDVGVAVVGMRDVLERERGEVRGRVADDVAERLVDAHERAVGGDERHPDRGVVERGPELRVGGRARRLGRLAIADVARRGLHAGEAVVGVAQGAAP